PAEAVRGLAQVHSARALEEGPEVSGSEDRLAQVQVDKEERFMERTLFIIKPDAMERDLAGRILAHAEGAGFKLVHARLARLTRSEAERFYAEPRERSFFGDLVSYMTSGPVLVTGLEREDAVRALREVVGATDPAEATDGTIRRRFGIDKQ